MILEICILVPDLFFMRMTVMSPDLYPESMFSVVTYCLVCAVVSNSMIEHGVAVCLILNPFSLAYNLKLNPAPLETYLNKRKWHL